MVAEGCDGDRSEPGQGLLNKEEVTQHGWFLKSCRRASDTGV